MAFAVLATQESQETMQNEPEVVIRPDDFFELFSTEPDLAGGFTNVSQFVRDQDRNVDVHVFWRDFDPAKETIDWLALDEAYRQGRIQRGDYLVVSGFGAGLAWGTALMRW